MDEMHRAVDVADGFAAAWNRHDMEALGRLFHDDAAFVNTVGLLMRGRESIEDQHGIIHGGAYKNSTLRVAVVDARWLGPGAIVAHVHSELDGDDRAPDQTRQTLMTLVIEQRIDEWKIVAAHNTAIATRAI